MADQPALSALAPGYRVRRPTMDDVEAMAAMIRVYEVADFGEADYSAADLRTDWEDVNLGEDAWLVVTADDEIVGYLSVLAYGPVRILADGYVHPAHTGRGIGTTLIRLSETRAPHYVAKAPAGFRVAIENGTNSRNPAACQLLEAQGYLPIRYFWKMEIDLAEPPPAPQWPEGIAVRSCEPGDERLVYVAVNEAFRDHWGYVPRPEEEWLTRQRRYGIDLALWFLALEGDQVAGAVTTRVSEGIGWVNHLAVRRPWRRRGVGRALLRHIFAEYAGRGISRVTLGVDAENPTGAVGLYEGAGMRVVSEYVANEKELRPGAVWISDE